MQTEEFATQLPTRGRRIKFTPERLQQIRNLVERGKSREEIAELIGVTVGSLQVTCSRLGISLRRVPVEQPQATTPHEEHARTDEVGLANLALGMKYRGDEQTSELLLTQDMIRQLAFEAQFRNMSIGEFVGELLIAMMKRDLFQHVLLEPNSKQP
jgi:hypothetical protein